MSTMPVQAHAGPSFGGFARVVFFPQHLRRGLSRRPARGHGRPQSAIRSPIGEASQAAPSTTRISRSTLPLPSALRASL